MENELDEYSVRQWFMKVDLEQAQDTYRVIEVILETRTALEFHWLENVDQALSLALDPAPAVLEPELAVVIGKPGRHIALEDALDYVAGYTVLNDVSARDLNRRTDYPFKHDWFRGKSFDTFGPLGPWLVPRACIAEPQNLRMRLTVNGETMQDGNTSEMIFSVAEQIHYLSSILTLQPGDVIATGTPTGVGMGRGIYLKPGDVMVASIDGIGSIENPLVQG